MKKAPVYKIVFRTLFRQIEDLIFSLKNKISERQFLFLSAILVAISCAIAVNLLKSFAHQVFVFATYVNGYAKLPFANSIFPIIGIVLTVWVTKKFLDGSLEKGSSRILYAIAKKGGLMPKKQLYAQIITSSLTVGLGGSAGLESPITITGAAFGSNFAQKYRLSQKDRILLLACGVASGIAAAFNAPIAGVLFAIEIILVDATITAFVPLIIAAATGALVSALLLQEEVAFAFTDNLFFNYLHTPYYVLLGILCGLVSVLHTRNFQKVEQFIASKKWGRYQKALFGALLLAVLIFFFPSLFGEGYESIKWITSSNPEKILENTVLDSFKSNEWILFLFVLVTCLLKSIATGLTLGSGGNGGNFAPSLFVGSYLGFSVVQFFNLTKINTKLPIINFSIVGMAGILSGLFHAPLTAIFLIGEITGGYSLIVPLMIVSSLSFAVSKRFEKHAMDVKKLAETGEVFTSNKDQNILLSININNLIIREITTINETNTIEDITKCFIDKNQKIIPYIDTTVGYLGVVDFEKIKSILLHPFKAKFTPANEMITTNYPYFDIDDDTVTLFTLFENHNINYIPVFQNLNCIGIISKTDLLASYREKYKEMIIE